MEFKEFKVVCNEHADWRKFKIWLRKAVAAGIDKEIPFDDEI